MFNKSKSKLISRGCIPIVLLSVLFVGFTTCKHSSSPTGETYTVIFDTMGGTPVPKPLVVSAGSKIDAPKGVTKTKNNLSGWYTDRDYEEEWIFEDHVVTGDMTLYARWGAARSGGGSSGGGGTIPPGTSAFSQVVMYREVIDTLGVIEIDIKHSNSQGPDPKNGDDYEIFLDGSPISSGKIQIVNNHVVFVPDESLKQHPFMGDFDTKGSILSVDHIPHSPHDDISVPGAALIDGPVEGEKADGITTHTHDTAELDTLDHFIDTPAKSFDAEPITSYNNQATAHEVRDEWIVGYKEGYFGWQMEDMYKIEATPITGPSAFYSAVNSTPVMGRGYYGEWKLGTSEPKNDLNVEIREDQKTSLQFKGGGAPYKLDLNADYGHGFPVGYIEITASGATNIVTLRVHLNDGYKLDGSEPVIVEWHSNNPSKLPLHLSSIYPYFKIPNAETTVVYTEVPSNISFKGATFKVFSKDAAHVEHGYVEPITPGTGNLYFVSEEDHTEHGNTIIVAAPNGVTNPWDMSYYPNYFTVDEYGNEIFEDYTDRNLNPPSPGWIFVPCTHGASCTLCSEYYTNTGSPGIVFPKSLVINRSPYFYKIETDDPPPPGTTLFYDEHTKTYYLPDEVVGPHGETMIADADGGPYFYETTIEDPSFGSLQTEYSTGNIIIHAAHNENLYVNDVIKDVPVGTVHIEYNRYEPDTDPHGPHFHETPYTITITYHFDTEFLAIMNGHSGWNYTCNVVNMKVNGTPKALSLSRIGLSDSWSILGYDALPLYPSTPPYPDGKIIITIDDINTHFFWP